MVGGNTCRVTGEDLLGDAQQLPLILLGSLIDWQPLLQRVDLL